MDCQAGIPASKRPRVWPVDIKELMYIPDRDNEAPGTANNVAAPSAEKIKREFTATQADEILQAYDFFATPKDVRAKKELIALDCEEDDAPQLVQDLGPFSVCELGKRQLAALNSGFMTDVMLIVGDQVFKCHYNILSFASPKLAVILTEKKPRLYDVDPRHFRLLLQVIYSGGTLEPQDVATLLKLGQLAVKLQVPAASSFCASSLARKVDSENLWVMFNFANLVSDATLQEACLQMIREDAGSILQTAGFLQCDRATLEMILKQNTLCNVTELQLFQACVAWSNAKPGEVESRRAALASAIHFIRFRLFSAEDFARYVSPTGLLSSEMERNIFRSCATGVSFMPVGFSMSTNTRDPSRIIEFRLFSSSGERRGYNPSLQNFRTALIAVDKDTTIVGVKLRAWRSHICEGHLYDENVSASLQGNAFSTGSLEVARFSGKVRKGDMITLTFEPPYQMIRFTNHALHVIYSKPNEKNLVYELYQKGSLKSATGLQVCGLNDFLAPPDLHLIVADKVAA